MDEAWSSRPHGGARAAHRSLGWVLLFAGAHGCAAEQVRPAIVTAHATRPGWIPSPNRTHPQLVYITASCTERPTRDLARQCALEDGARQIADRLGTPDAQVSQRVIEDEYVERSNGGYDLWLLLAYPRAKVREASRRNSRHALIGFACDSEPSGACPPSDADGLEQTLATAGFTTSTERLRELDLAAARQRADASQSARLLLARCSARFLAQEEGEFFAEARCGYRWIDALSGNVLRTYDSGPVKGGHINQAAATRRAVEQSLAALRADLSHAQ